MKNKPSKTTIEIKKHINIGAMPLFVEMYHRGLEKSQPEPVAAAGKLHTFNVSKDMLRLTLTDPALVDLVESLEFTYEQP